MSELILVVDDDPVQRRLLEGILDKLGYKAMSVDGGQEALDALSSELSIYPNLSIYPMSLHSP